MMSNDDQCCHPAAKKGKGKRKKRKRGEEGEKKRMSYLSPLDFNLSHDVCSCRLSCLKFQSRSKFKFRRISVRFLVLKLDGSLQTNQRQY
mmetsp:Transcript_3906/g.5643  ORF Transcript_3906/g.5643 Transcript_3906/m.5643 type:complete len:90 (+) Transcript_3906:2335-2604(+)